MDKLTKTLLAICVALVITFISKYAEATETHYWSMNDGIITTQDGTKFSLDGKRAWDKEGRELKKSGSGFILE